MRRSPPVRMTKSGSPTDEARHLGAQGVGSDVVGANAARGHCPGELARRVGNLLATTVREGERQRHLPVSLGIPAEGVEHGAHQGGEAAEVADGIEPDAVVEDLVSLAQQKILEQEHERVDLLLRTRPVLLAEGVERERTQAEAARRANRAPDRGSAFAVAAGAGVPTELRPAAIAVHDDADVPGEIAGFDEVHSSLGPGNTGAADEQ